MDEQTVLEVLRGVLDPEVGINIVDLGLVYKVDIHAAEGTVHLTLTMTSPACPLGEQIAREAVQLVEARVPGAKRATAELVWEPFWTPARMSGEARRTLGWRMGGG